MRPASHSRGQRGVTLIELMIAVSLTAVISVGLLFALRTGALAYEKTSQRLRSNREQINRDQILARQLGGAIPALSACGVSMMPYFIGTPGTLRLISSYSIAEGFRGYPQILEFQVTPSPAGGVRLVVTEHPYSGPLSTASFCGEGGEEAFDLAGAAPASLVLADGLAACEFSYHQPIDPMAFQDSGWVTDWRRNTLPGAVKVEMKPMAAAGAGLPSLGVTVRLRVDRDIFRNYEDF